MTEAGLFDKLIKVKYEIPNDKPEMFAQYTQELDDICTMLLAKQHGGGKVPEQSAAEKE
jgi:V/A-type H+-transporting ATPase subunit A